MDNIDKILEKDISDIRRAYKNEGLRRAALNDKVFTEVLNRLSLEERLRVLYYCIVNDTFQKIKN